LSNCVFTNNSASNFGNDVFYYSASTLYSSSNTQGSCSSSSTYHISGSSTSYTFNLNSCSFSDDEYLLYCSPSYCDEFITKSDCISDQLTKIKDGRCFWILSGVDDIGSCISSSTFDCENFNNYDQCIYSNDQINGEFNCFWDISDSLGKCKINTSDNPGVCFNSDHYEIINSNCTLFACSLRTPKTSGSNRCGDDCYFESEKDKCLLEECSKYNVIECASVPNCTVVKRICLDVIVEKVNSTVVGNAVGGFFIKYINIY
jgi:hypothetical protein